MFPESKLLIKGMVCQRCILVVQSALQQLGLHPVQVSLGEATVITSPWLDRALIDKSLKPLGFGLMEDRKVRLVNSVKRLVAEVYSGTYDFPEGFRFTALLMDRLHRDYDTVGALFSQLEHQTLERYIIGYRIEKIREMLAHTDRTVSDLAFQLNFSSTAHLSRQFKQYTGLAPSQFREVARKAQPEAVQLN